MTDAIEQLSCQEVVELVTDYLEGALPAEERARFEQHLESCEGCRRYVEQMRMTLGLTGELTPESLTPQGEQALLKAFRDWRSS